MEYGSKVLSLPIMTGFDELKNLKRLIQFLFLTLSVIPGLSNLYGQSNGFTTAYDAMHQAFSYYYPFGHWKAIKWDDLNSRIRPKIVSAGTANDTIAFYTALKEYVTSVPDGHISLHGWDTLKVSAMYRGKSGEVMASSLFSSMMAALYAGWLIRDQRQPWLACSSAHKYWRSTIFPFWLSWIPCL
jgi:hypothetical protein